VQHEHEALGVTARENKIVRMSLSLTAPGYELLRIVQWIMVLTIVVSAGLAAWLWADARDMDRQAVEYEQATARVQDANRQYVRQAAQSGQDLSEDRIRGLARQVAFANQLLEKGAFSWTRFLTHLEEAVAPRISFSSVNLSFKDSVITLNGSALTLKDLTAQIDKLEGHPAFRNVVLSQHQMREEHDSRRSKPANETGDTDTPLETVSFTMTVVYQPR
jgi:hypothetical protein